MRIRRTLRYAQTNTIDVANFGISAQVFRANSLYDPDYTGTGHQPNGFDQLIAAYNHYTVVGCRIRVSQLQIGTGGGNIEPGFLVLAWSDTGTFIVSQSSLQGTLEKRNVLASTAYAGNNAALQENVLQGTISIAKLLGKTDQQLVEMANLRGDASSNPVEGYFFELGLMGVSSNPGAITVIVELEYDAVFTEPVTNFGDS